MHATVTVLAEGLGHPEGPDVLPDGRVILANTYASEVSVWEPGADRATTYAYTGGGPNAVVRGSDGCLYLTNCPTVGKWVAPDPRPPSILRVTPSGAVEEVCTEVDGVPLLAPNDLAFGADRRLYFTDSGEWDPVNKPDPGRVYALARDGTAEVFADLGPTYPNGVAGEADGAIVWVESFYRRVRRKRPGGKVEDVCTLPEGHIPDGLKVDVEGNLWIAAFSSGAVDIVAPDGRLVDSLETGGSVPLNCVFGPAGELYVCDFGTADTSGSAPMCGRLLRFDVGVPGLPLFRGSVEPR